MNKIQLLYFLSFKNIPLFWPYFWGGVLNNLGGSVREIMIYGLHIHFWIFFFKNKPGDGLNLILQGTNHGSKHLVIKLNKLNITPVENAS